MNRRGNLFEIQDLVDSDEFAEFREIMRDLVSTTPTVFDHDGQFCVHPTCDDPGSEAKPICRLILATPEGRRACLATNTMHTADARTRRTAFYYLCHAGLVDFIVPLHVDDQLVGFLSGGQLLVDKINEANYMKLRQELEHYGVDTKALRKAYFKSQYTPPEKIKLILNLFEFFGRYFCEMNIRLRKAEVAHRHPEILQAEQYIKNHFREPISRSDVAGLVGLSPAYFSRAFAKVVGENYIVHLYRLRLRYAKRLLLDSNDSITQISRESGFSSVSHFNKVFRQKLGTSPREYRQQRGRSPGRMQLPINLTNNLSETVNRKKATKSKRK